VKREDQEAEDCADCAVTAEKTDARDSKNWLRSSGLGRLSKKSAEKRNRRMFCQLPVNGERSLRRTIRAAMLRESQQMHRPPAFRESAKACPLEGNNDTASGKLGFLKDEAASPKTNSTPIPICL
jgi:hypothetical protein